MDLRLMACVAAAGCLLLIGCGQEFSASNSGGSGGSGASGGTGGSGASAGSSSNGGGSSVGGGSGNCEDGLLHAPPVPEPWMGPFAVAVADETPLPCVTPAVQLHAGLKKTDESCACSCGEDLSKCSGFVSEHEQGICSSPATQFYSLPHGLCVPTLPPLVAGEMELHIEPLPDAGVCAKVPDATFGSEWDRTVEMCGVNPGREGCTQVPDGYNKTLCIQVPGSDAICPAEYSFGCTLYESVADSRTCNDDNCYCSDITVSCGGMIDGYSDNQCLNVSNTQECMPFNQAPMQLRYAADLEGECIPGGEAVVQGELAEAGPTRVCCTEPSNICQR